MSVAIPKQLKKKVEQHRKKLGMSEHEYLARALTRFVEWDGTAEFYQQSGFDPSLAEELAMWDRASQYDFAAFAKTHKL